MALLAHRGPDGSGIYINDEEQVAFGHVRLAVLDLSPSGHQPMVSQCGRAVLAYNGEIFNFQELRAELVSKGWTFRGNSDSEVLLSLYLTHGEQMLDRLNGMFAFAIWDVCNRSVLLARDGIGIKPLYYAEEAGSVLFASEMKALLPFKQLMRRIDPVALRDHLAYLWAPGSRTIMNGVSKLQPGHALWVQQGKIKRHWRWDNPPASLIPRGISSRSAVKLVHDTLQQAVQRQLVSDVPVGAFLSGGLDSGAVAALAQRSIRASEGAAPLQCFTIAADEQEQRSEGMVSDLPYARKLAHHLGVVLHEVAAPRISADDLLQMVWQLDEPLADLAPLNVLAIARLARERGIPVLLSGAGGDDIFTGYRRHQLWTAEQRMMALPHWIRAGLARAARYIPTSNLQLRRLRKAINRIDQSGDARIASLFEWLEPAWVNRLLSPDMREASQHNNPLLQSLDTLPDEVPGLNRILHLECTHFLADHNLTYTDKMSMAAGVEVRVPLLDKDMVHLAFSLPLRVKQRGMQSKWVLKRAMRGILPDDVIHRPKTGFGLPLRVWLRGPLRPLLHDTLSHSSIQRRGIFDSVAVQRLLVDNDRGNVDGAYALLSLLCIELWCRAFLDGQPST
jgi:asparagine synthase (glutamine-hydrolysing)